MNGKHCGIKLWSSEQLVEMTLNGEMDLDGIGCTFTVLSHPIHGQSWCPLTYVNLFQHTFVLFSLLVLIVLH